MPKLETMIRISSEFDFSDIEIDSISALELTIDLGHLIMKNQINKTFGNLLHKVPDEKDNLYILSRIRLMLHEGGILTLINTYTGNIEESYLKRIEILLNKAGFIDIEIRKNSSPQIIKAVRRSVEVEKLNHGFILKEEILPEKILRCHQFAKDYYYYKDFNYDIEVVKPFDINCDHFVVYDENDEIISLARIVIRTPGHCCPFMYATISGVEGNKHFTIPGKDKRIGEVMAIFSAGKKGITAFKQMMEYLTQYGTNIAHFDSVWTTYDDSDNYTGTYYKNKFIMEDTGIKLQYSDFGGIWNLIVTDRILELKGKYHKTFRFK